jgi:hypothetical protein
VTAPAFPLLSLPVGSSSLDPARLGQEIAQRCYDRARILASGAGRTLPRVLRAHHCRLPVYVDASGFLAVVHRSSKAPELLQATVFRPHDGELCGHYVGTRCEVARALRRDGYAKVRP